jgi:ribosome assembly protein YihI (activator of Der GTPase)
MPRCLRHRSRMNTPQSRLVREAVLRELDAGRYVHIRPQRLPPECLDRVEALADKHGIDRDFARRLAAELHRYEDAA